MLGFWGAGECSPHKLDVGDGSKSHPQHVRLASETGAVRILGWVDGAGLVRVHVRYRRLVALHIANLSLLVTRLSLHLAGDSRNFLIRAVEGSAPSLFHRFDAAASDGHDSDSHGES